MTVHNRAQRVKRALYAALTGIVAAVAGVFIPVAHFFLVPGALLLGAYFSAKRLLTETTLRDCNGTCPDCGTDQTFEISATATFPQSTSCEACHRGLTLRALDLA